MISPVEASALAGDHLAANMPRRWRHVQGVARRAEAIGHVVEGDAGVLVAAAWLHDIGYAPGIVDTGFHPLDGARWLRETGIDDRVVALVAHHSCSRLEADERGLTEQLVAEFPREESATADALWYCDMTVGPDGQLLDPQDRIAEIKTRYGPGEVVTRFIGRAEPEIMAAVRRTEERLGAAPDHPM